MTCSTTEITRVRLYIGDLDATLVSDLVVQLYLNEYSDKATPVKEYFAALASLSYAITNQSQTGSKRREKKGPFEIEIDGTQVNKSLKSAYDFLKKNPPKGVPKALGIMFGGVSLEEYNRVTSDTDRLDSQASIGWFSNDIGDGVTYPEYVNTGYGNE